MKQEKIKDSSLKNLKKLTNCPYCGGKLIKRGIRKKKYEIIQRYYCPHCKKSFTSAITKNHTFPLKVIIDSLSLYNRLFNFKEISQIIKEDYGLNISTRTLFNWVKEYEKYTPFSRMRKFASEKYSKKELIENIKLIHKQIYNFKFHRAKIDITLNEEFRHYKFKPLKDFLELVSAECPHELFRNSSKRASEFKGIFNLNKVKIISKKNTATKITNFVIQSVVNNKKRHEILEDFMLSNDSSTVAVEVPVIINSDDLRHLKHELNFKIPLTLEDGEYITGHIDFVQIRNGSIYILDYKPSAKKEKPIEQLTLYALALSRLTGLRVYNFKCAWFDKNNYYEFYPLHVVYKKNKKKRTPRNQKTLILNK